MYYSSTIIIHTSRPTFGDGTTNFTQGGVDLIQAQNVDPTDQYRHIKGPEGFYGWMGFGGSVFQVIVSLNIVKYVNWYIICSFIITEILSIYSPENQHVCQKDLDYITLFCR